MSEIKEVNPERKEESGIKSESVLANRNFRLLWGGEAISLLGDQFYLIALPWLVLQLTGDALAVGTVLAAAAVPRAIFMLVGGALTDRFSPRTVMLVSNLSRFGLVSLLAFLVLAGAIELWMLYLLALAFGLADAFFYPAQNAIVPELVGESKLQTANSIVQGTAQFSLFLGPVLAGSLIALISSRQGDGASGSELTGIAMAFLFDAATFLVSALTLWFIRTEHQDELVDNSQEKESVLVAIREGLINVWQDKTLRYFFLVVAAVATIMNSLLSVGVPILADQRFSEGAAAFGIIMSAYGAGSLIGIVLAGVLPKPPEGRLGTVLLLATGIAGLAIVLIGLASTTALAAIVSLVMGTSLGYVVIQFTTWLQIRTPSELMGRMMSILMFASVGLTPLGTALAGAVIEVNLNSVFFGAGMIILLTVSLAMTNRTVRAMPLEAVMQ
jgi:MFS family permease